MTPEQRQNLKELAEAAASPYAQERGYYFDKVDAETLQAALAEIDRLRVATHYGRWHVVSVGDDADTHWAGRNLPTREDAEALAIKMNAESPQRNYKFFAD